MASAVAGNIIVHGWTVLDGAKNPLTGVTSPAGISLVLQRQSGSTVVDASEAVSWTEIGATGRYYLSYTPQNSGEYTLYGKELHASSLKRTFEFRDQVVSAGAAFAPSYANAFCAETDVERYLLQPITATSKPNDTEVAGFAQGRADALESLCAGLGNAVTPATVPNGSRLEGLLREANAIGAALDCIVAQAFQTGASTTRKAEALQEEWDRYVGVTLGGELIAGRIEMEIRGNLVSLATSHILSGDTTARDSDNAPTDIGFQIRMSDTF